MITDVIMSLPNEYGVRTVDFTLDGRAYRLFARGIQDAWLIARELRAGRYPAWVKW